MNRLNRRTLLVQTLILCCTSGSARAALVGTGTMLTEVQGTQTDNVVCSRFPAPSNQTYDVFGTPVNLSTDLGEVVCAASTVGGVLQNSHCESYPDNSIYSADAVTYSICLDGGCTGSSFVSDDIFNTSGTFFAMFGSDIVFRVDGQNAFTGFAPAPTITGAGCNLANAGVAQFQGTIAFNAFQKATTAVGSNQSVGFPGTTYYNPISGQTTSVDIQIDFAQVAGAGSTTVTASSNASAAIPSNFVISQSGFQATFLDIATTASVSGPITICSSYEDADDDGFLDGTSPAIPESALSFLHGEGDPVTLVDRTSSRDADANVICATVDHLSPFAVLVRTSGLCDTEGEACDDGDACTTGDACDADLDCVGTGEANCDDGSECTEDYCESPTGCVHDAEPALFCDDLPGQASILLRSDSVGPKDQVVFKWLKADVALDDLGDPTTATAYSLCAYDDNGLLVGLDAPAASTCGSKPCWSFTGPSAAPKGIKYVDPQRSHDGIKLIKGNAKDESKGSVMVVAQGDNIPAMDLSSVASSVLVQLRTTDAGCWQQEFSSDDQKKNDGSKFLAVHKEP